MKPHVYDVLARVFIAEDVRVCFALLGDANMNWAARLSEQGCRMIYVRHEHCALAAAMAYARKNSDVGVATVTCGPGVTQLITALPAAVRAHLPLVVFAGEAPLKSGWYNQEIDQAPIITATGAAYHRLHMIERMPVAIRDAFVQAHRERRPVIVGVPFDLQNRPWDGPADLPKPSRQLLPRPSPIPPHRDDVAKAAQLIASAERVVVLAGLGAVEAGAGAACRALAAKIGGLLSTTLPARGLFHDDPFCIGISGSFTPEIGIEYLAQADLVIAVGCSLAYHAGGGGQLWPKAKMLQVDIDPVGISQGQEVASHHLRADARLGLEALTAALTARNGSWRSDAMAARIRDAKPDSHVIEIEPGMLDPRDVVEALEKNLPRDWEMVNSGGHCSWFFAQMPSRPQQKFLTIREFGAIGNGISFAMGVAAARPDRTVVLFDGDGSLMMHVQELETIKRHRLNILIVVMNDGAYGSELHKLRSEGMLEDGSVFGYCDFAGIARGFGLPGKTVKSLDDLPKLVAEFAASGGAAVWDFHVSDKVVSPTIRRAHPQAAKTKRLMATEEPLDEAARAQHAYLILKKHLGRAGVAIKPDELPTTWFSFSWLFYLNIGALARGESHATMLRELLAELVRFTQAYSGEHFAHYLYELLKGVIGEQKLCTLIEPLLPPEAQARMEELREMLWKERDDDRRRADEGYY